MDVEEFRWRLAETIAWCAPRVDVRAQATCLRTPALCPPGYTYTQDDIGFTPDPDFRFAKEPELQELLAAIAAERIHLLQQMGQYPTTPAPDLAGGKLIFYAPDQNLAEGCEAEESGGFYDLYAGPPWDTWLCYIQATTPYRGEQAHWYDEFIIAWVPPELLAVAEIGLQTTTTESICWADGLDNELLQGLRALQVIT